MVDKASTNFKCINIDVGTLPNLRHYACMMDILGRAGDFCKVMNMLKSMPLEGDLSFWMGLLGACRIHGNADLGKHAFDLAVQLHPKEASAYIMMSYIYMVMLITNTMMIWCEILCTLYVVHYYKSECA